MTACMNLEAVRRHFNTLIEQGVGQKTLENALGISREELAEDNARVAIGNVINMLRKGAERIGPDLGITLGAEAPIEMTGVLGQILKNCQTMKEAALQFIRFQNLFFAVSRFQITERGNYAALIHTMDYPLSDDDKRLITELNLAAFVSIVRLLVGKQFIPKEVHFSHKKPGYARSYDQFFQCPVKFSAKEDAFLIDKNISDTPIPGSHPYMKNILVDHAEGLRAKLEQGKQFQNKVKCIAVNLLPRGLVDIERIAEALHISRWTLTRRLKKEGITFKDLLADLRKDLAVTYLENKNLSITEIAYLLGYSEASAFQRAFKNRTGTNPRQHRQKQ